MEGINSGGENGVGGDGDGGDGGGEDGGGEDGGGENGGDGAIRFTQKLSIFTEDDVIFMIFFVHKTLDNAFLLSCFFSIFVFFVFFFQRCTLSTQNIL